MQGFLLRYLPFAIGAALLAGISHILVLLVLPAVAQRSAVARLGMDTTANVLEVLAPTRPGEMPLPFADPALAMAVCRFDISEFPVRLRVPTGEHFLSVVILSPTGKVIYGLTDKAATRRLLDMVILTDQQLKQLESQDPEDEPVQELRARVRDNHGVAIIRTLAPRPGDLESAQAMLKRATCQGLGEPG